MCQVTFHDYGTVTVEPGTTIAEAARQLGIPLSAPCGGHGKCGKCKVNVNGREVLACTYPVFEDISVLLPPPEEAKFLTAGASAAVRLDPVYPGYLIAIDIGTTTVVCSLLSPAGEELAVKSMTNPQSAYGADVLSRIQWALREGSLPLTAAIRDGIAELISHCCRAAGVEPEQIGVISMVGNSCMQQLFMGIPVDNLAAVPFAPVITRAVMEDAKEYLPLCPNAKLLTLPEIDGFVGADTLGCILAAGLHKTNKTTLLVDIGTNGEMVLAHEGRLAACSTAAGPALEGASILFGMRGAAGAIDHVYHQDGKVRCTVIGSGPAKGICGSGIVDAVAVMLEAGQLNRRGRIQSTEEIQGQRFFPLQDGIYLTQEDIRQVQLAKGAIAAGIMLLCDHFGITVEEIDQVILAGAFGSYMVPDRACRIGLLPPALSGRVTAGGNLALSGAVMLALDRSQLALAQRIAAQVHPLNLSAHPAFPKTFAQCMGFLCKRSMPS